MNLPHLYLALQLGVTSLEFRRYFWYLSGNQSPCSQCDPRSSRLCTTPTSGGRTDRRTDGQTDRQTMTVNTALAQRCAVKIMLAFRKSTTDFPMSYRWSAYVIPKSPKDDSKAIFRFLKIKFNFSRIKSATKFLCEKTTSDIVVVWPFQYPMVHRYCR